MTLTVSVYKVEADGTETELPLASDLVGTESTRTSFYAGSLSLQLGLTLLPRLQEQSVLKIRGAALTLLLSEVSLLVRDLPDNIFGEYWRFRLNNIKLAAELAHSHGSAGYVLIG